MSDSENSAPEKSAPQEQSPEPSQPSNDFFGGAGLKEIEQTYEMLIGSKKAIQQNEHWHGADVGNIAMLLSMLMSMERQYRNRLEQLRTEQKEAMKRAKEEIRKAGGQVNGDPNGTTVVPATPAS